MPSSSTSVLDEVVREGFDVRCWTQGRHAVITARQAATGSPLPPRPALPSRARIVVWSDGSGQIRALLQKPTRISRFVAWLRGRALPTRAEELDALADELLAAISEVDPEAPWLEIGDSALPRIIIEPPPLPGARGAGRQLALVLVAAVLSLGLLVGVVALSGDSAEMQDEGPPLSQSPPVEASQSQEADVADVSRTQQLGNAEGSETATQETIGGREQAPESIRTLVSSAELSRSSEGGASTTDAQDDPAQAQYVVQDGDVLLAIAARHDVSLEALVEANAIEAGSRIFPGQVLRIP